MSSFNVRQSFMLMIKISCGTLDTVQDAYHCCISDMCNVQFRVKVTRSSALKLQRSKLSLENLSLSICWIDKNILGCLRLLKCALKVGSKISGTRRIHKQHKRSSICSSGVRNLKEIRDYRNLLTIFLRVIWDVSDPQ